VVKHGMEQKSTAAHHGIGHSQVEVCVTSYSTEIPTLMINCGYVASMSGLVSGVESYL
jgi:hypothetical protein